MGYKELQSQCDNLSRRVAEYETMRERIARALSIGADDASFSVEKSTENTDGCAGEMLAVEAQDAGPLEVAANKVAQEFAQRPGQRQRAFDPTMILTFASALISFFQQCQQAKNNPANVVARARQLQTGNAGLLDRLLIHRRTRLSMNRRDWQEYGGDVAEALIAACAASSPREVQEAAIAAEEQQD